MKASTIKYYFLHPNMLFAKLGSRGLFNWMSDKLYLQIAYYLKTGRTLNLDDPQLFNEKLQWLKLYDRKPLYSSLVDKYEVRTFIKNIIGEEYLIPLLGVWERFEDIDFSVLPEQFVLKCTHDSGSGAICRDKKTFDKKEAKRVIGRSLKHNYFWNGREWPYKNVKPKVIAEKYMTDESQPQLIDYKFYCMNGEVKFLYISQGLENHTSARISFYDLDWRPLLIRRSDYRPFDHIVPKPYNADMMVELAQNLAKHIEADFVRIDLYEINKRIYFSEFTFFPCGGMMPFEPSKYDRIIGNELTLSNMKKN